MTGFLVPFEALSAQDPALGRVARLPWDSEIFGFNVGTYEVAEPVPPAAPREQVSGLLNRWIADHEIEVLSCMVPADAFGWMAWLAASGFVFVDLALQARLRSLNGLPAPRVTVRLANEEDSAGIDTIAATAFRFGRYLADPRFPRQLAYNRFRSWMARAVTQQSDHEFVYVTGPAGSPTGFLHATLLDGVADLRLVAVDPAEKSGIVGPTLLPAVLADLRGRGARNAKVQLSAGNVSALSLYGTLGFLFSKADAVYHLHSQTPRHLSPPI